MYPCHLTYFYCIHFKVFTKSPELGLCSFQWCRIGPLTLYAYTMISPPVCDVTCVATKGHPVIPATSNVPEAVRGSRHGA